MLDLLAISARSFVTFPDNEEIATGRHPVLTGLEDLLPINPNCRPRGVNPRRRRRCAGGPGQGSSVALATVLPR